MSIEITRAGIVALLFALATPVIGVADDQAKDDAEDKPLMSAETFAGLKLRSLGPALMSGRVGDFAVNPNNRAHYYVAVCSGGVWKTVNAGATWTPVFDKEGSFSIGCVTMDPKNPDVVWVGTGENNSQRSVAFGDGVYRTRDGGQHWENMGLKESEHIGMITIDPRDSDTVYVAAQGPLWKAGGDRGLYKTTDGGQTWKCILEISENTGVNEIHFDPRDPDVLYASAYQRRRRVWTLINGGPESALYKSTDAGETWRKLKEGLPEVDMGRIGLGISPVNPDVVYAQVEATDGKTGFFRSRDRGETWERRSDYKTTSPQYYNEIVCDPIDVDRIYILDTFLRVTEDAGKTMQRVPRVSRHVDDHALWIDPADNNYLLIGCDGGVYESFDRGGNWAYKANLPITQFYRVAVDNSTPFYYVYGGTQDNTTQGGPTRTTDRIGIGNEHWFVAVGGDGYKAQIDPEDPMIVYCQWQYGGLTRFDRRSGERTDIKPREGVGEEPFRWNWDSPLLLSPHNPKRLYYAANKLFRTDNGGDSWTAISGDLSRQLDRDTLEVMGRIQKADAVAKSESTSFYGNIVSLNESPLVEGLIYVGTDDGLIHVTEDGGRNWRKTEGFPNLPELVYVSCLTASLHDSDTVYAAFDNHKNGDFKPYVFVSADRGRSWKSISGDLPERDIVYGVLQDHVNPDLLFAGTEFGVYFTTDAGEHWIQLKGGVPTIAVRDIELQRRENDLVLGTFGRGFYVLDDYSPLRTVSEEQLGEPATFFPVKDALQYIERNRLGGPRGRGSQGASYYAAENPPFGAVFTYYLGEKLMTRKERRHEAEKQAEKEEQTPAYPTIEELRAEDEEKEPQIVFVVRDSAGEVVSRVVGKREKGFQRVAWNLRYPAPNPTELKPPKDRPPWAQLPIGPLVLPGEYSATLVQVVDGVETSLSDSHRFKVIPLELATFAAKNKPEVLAFQMKIARLQRAVQGAVKAAQEADKRLAYLRKAFVDTPSADKTLLGDIETAQKKMNSILTALRGDRTKTKRDEPTPPSISSRASQLTSQWRTTSPATQTQREVYGYASAEFADALGRLRTLVEKDLAALESRMEAAGAPWTPGRLPKWKKE